MIKIIILLLILLTSCKNELDISNKLYADIQGDWLIHHNVNSPSFLSIKDSLLFSGEHIDSFQTFRMNKDTIDIINSKYDYHFSRITPKYLRIIDKKTGKEIPIFVNSKIFRDEMLELRSLEVRFRNDYRGLLDWGLILNDRNECYIKLFYSRKYKFIKNPFKDYPLGIYKGKFSKNDFSLFRDKFKNIPVDSLKNSYLSSHYGHNRGCVNPDYDIAEIFMRLSYSYGNSSKIKTKKIIAKGYEDIPAYLGIFVNYLNKISTFVEFQSDTTSTYDFQFFSKEFKNNHRDIFFPFEKIKVQVAP